MTSPSDLQSAIARWADDRAEDIIQLTESLVRYPSVQHVPSGDEKDCQMFVADTLRRLNLDVDIFEPTAVPGLAEHPVYWQGRDYTDRPNVVGTWRGTEPSAGRSLLFSSHVDVVAPVEGGRFDAFTPVREGDRLYGRGSNDMKGGLAATIMAVRCLQELGVRLKGDVIVESVVDEEMGGSNGTLASRVRGYNADGCIVPEPNQMLVSPAHRGGCMWRITLRGASGMPFGTDELINPAYGVGELVVAIQQWEKARNQRTQVPPLYTTTPGLPVLVTHLSAGDFVRGTGDSVPRSAMLEVWVEVYPGTTFEALYDEFIGYIKDVAAKSPLIQRCDMDIHQEIRFLPASEIPVDAPIVQAVRQSYARMIQREPEIRGAQFACDVWVFNQYSPTPCVILGPRGENAHAPDEWVLMDDLVNLTKIFALTAAEWCNSK